MHYGEYANIYPRMKDRMAEIIMRLNVFLILLNSYWIMLIESAGLISSKSFLSVGRHTLFRSIQMFKKGFNYGQKRENKYPSIYGYLHAIVFCVISTYVSVINEELFI